MSIIKQGRQSFSLCPPVTIGAWASIAGKKETQGPLGSSFDRTFRDGHLGKSSWEQAEQRLQSQTLGLLLQKAGLQPDELDLVLSGDLLNQCIGSSFSLRNTGIPHLGLYGACSTMAESLVIGSMAVGSGAFFRAASMTSSHFATAERQYRFPLGYGGQRPPTAQWTVTGAGAALLCARGRGPVIEGCTVGSVSDLGIRDAGNMGAAMAPAAYRTICTHFENFSCSWEDFDMVVTGDLGHIGVQLLLELAERDGMQPGGILQDCGCMIFDSAVQDTHAGGSGCGCSAAVLCGHLLNRMEAGELNRILFCGTGALLSPTSTQQGLPIPGICHAVSISRRD